ncbi:hypothetical protein GF366_03550 [Candidatus Peregrinibacteria bacterium]|nr:hypothetical protein [Candidatus Peregrinibacteria bacterium]
MKKIFALFLSILILTACSQKYEPKDTIANFVRYENTEKGVAMQYPTEWMKDESAPGTLISFMSPLEGDNDQFQENVSIAVQKLDKKYDLEEFVDISVSEIEKLYPDMNMEKSNTELDGNEAFKVVYDFKQFNFHFKSMQVYSIVNNSIYIVTFVSEYDNYDKYINTVNKMVGTMEIF